MSQKDVVLILVVFLLHLILFNFIFFTGCTTKRATETFYLYVHVEKNLKVTNFPSFFFIELLMTISWFQPIIFQPPPAHPVKNEAFLLHDSHCRALQQRHQDIIYTAIHKRKLKAASCKEEVVCENNPETPPSSLAQSSSKMF